MVVENRRLTRGNDLWVAMISPRNTTMTSPSATFSSTVRPMWGIGTE